MFAQAWGKIERFWPDLSLSLKGLVVVAITLGAVLESAISFYAIQRAERAADGWAEHASAEVNAIQDCLAHFLDGESADRGVPADLDRLEGLLGDEPAQLRSLRRQALLAVAGGALMELSGVFAILLFTAGVARRVKSLQHNAARLERGLAPLRPLGGRDEMGSLAAALEKLGASLRHSEEERDRFFTLSLDMMCIATLDGKFQRVNPAFTKTLGHAEEMLLTSNLLDLVHPNDRDTTAARLREVAGGTPIAHFENRVRCADGSYRWLAWSIAPFLAEALAYAVARDRTKLKLDEQALRQSDARLYCVLDSMNDAYMALDCGWHFKYINPAAERLLLCTAADLMGRDVWQTFPAAKKYQAMYDQAVRTGVAAHFEEFYAPLDTWYEVHAYPSAEGISVYLRDVTEHRQADEKTYRALKEKEVLLREIHHRVKNNLQVICSMLRLQAGYVHDESLAEVLRECRERVHAMAMLHDQLHRAKDFSSINMGEYLRNLAASLFCSYGVNSAQVGLTLSVEDITVPVDTAIPCGLIVHEMVSNAVRHAFPQGARGQVSLGLHACPDEQIELTVCDDGTGFSEAPDLQVRSLGLRLIHLLAEQIEASMERSSQAGTQYRLVFQQKKAKGEQTR